MNNSIKGVLIFAVGAFVGTLCTRKFLEEKYAQIAQEEIDSMRQVAACRMPRRSRVVDEPVDNRVDGGRDRYEKMAERYNGDSNVDNAYSDPSELEETRNENEEYDDYERLSNETNGSDNDGLPYVITIEQFSDEMGHFDKSTIYYYTADGVLADENEEMLDDPISIIGDDAENILRTRIIKDVVYVRNERLSTDYEIICVNGSYSDISLGYVKRDGRKGT